MNKTIPEFSALFVIAALGIVLAGCITTGPGHGGSHPVQPVLTAAGSTGELHLVAGANNRFAFDLYSELIGRDCKNAGSNIFFSPFSISSAFALTYEGARGTTADEIRSVFYFPSDTAALREGFAGLTAGMNRGKAAYTLRTANALFAQESYPFLPDYINTAARYYGSDTTNLDFLGNPEGSRQTINRWVEEKTDEKVKELLPIGSVDGTTRLVIANAVYFNGKWEKPFAKADTRDFPFYPDESFNASAPVPVVTVPMMQREDVYPYAETDSLQMVALPYKGGDGSDLSMLVILPRNYGLAVLADVEKSLNPATLSDLEDRLAETKIALFLPKFRLEREYRLPGILKGMGMQTAFDGSADFSGMDGTRSLFISDAIHKAFVDVNEEGTVAAAASAVMISQGGSSGRLYFVADHPFIVIIKEKETGTILFMGRVANPAAR